ncbi:hypothetical protein NIES2101_14425 [Calothrix sp. HK-06]|nr:hypothetical protein NIES2101_14425 [Calothrix sp. HK-06]
MPGLKISDLSFCEVVAEKEIDVKGGLTIAELTSTGVVPLLRRFMPGLSELDSVSDVPLEVKSSTSEDGSTVEMLENKSIGISGLQVTTQDGRSKFSMLTGNNFQFASASTIQLSGS